MSRHGIEIPRQTLARRVIQCSDHFQPLLNLMSDRLLESPVIHCDETRVQVLKKPDRDPPDKKVVLFNYTTSRTQEVPFRLLDSYRGYVMTDNYAGYNALALQSGVERLACLAQARRKFVDALEPNSLNPRHRVLHRTTNTHPTNVCDERLQYSPACIAGETPRLRFHP